jgi:hypothetical protein
MIEITDITPNTVLVDGRVVRRRPGRSALEWLDHPPKGLTRS